MNKVLTRISHPLRGLLYAVKNDPSFQSQFFWWIALPPLYVARL